MIPNPAGKAARMIFVLSGILMWWDRGEGEASELALGGEKDKKAENFTGINFQEQRGGRQCKESWVSPFHRTLAKDGFALNHNWVLGPTERSSQRVSDSALRLWHRSITIYCVLKCTHI